MASAPAQMPASGAPLRTCSSGSGGDMNGCRCCLAALLALLLGLAACALLFLAIGLWRRRFRFRFRVLFLGRQRRLFPPFLNLVNGPRRRCLFRFLILFLGWRRRFLVGFLTTAAPFVPFLAAAALFVFFHAAAALFLAAAALSPTRGWRTTELALGVLAASCVHPPHAARLAFALLLPAWSKAAGRARRVH